jgi:hypothetical protein
MQIGLRVRAGDAGVGWLAAAQETRQSGPSAIFLTGYPKDRGGIAAKHQPAVLVLRSASTCLLIALPLSWYISDETKVQFGREGLIPAKSAMPLK